MNALPDLEALRLNDRAAWELLFSWLSPFARKSARLQLRGYPEQDVEAVGADALLKLVDSVREVRTVEELLPLVRTIAKRLGIDHRRRADAQKRGKALESSLDQLHEQSGDVGLGSSPDRPDDEMQRRERLSHLDQVLKKLNPPLMELLVGFYIMGHSYAELARAHHLAVGSVGVYLNRGMEKLRSEISRHSGLDDALRILATLAGPAFTLFAKHS